MISAMVYHEGCDPTFVCLSYWTLFAVRSQKNEGSQVYEACHLYTRSDRYCRPTCFPSGSGQDRREGGGYAQADDASVKCKTF